MSVHFKTQLRDPQFFQMIISDNTSADFVLISADVILKMITILKEPRIAQLCSKNGRTLDNTICTGHDTLLFFLLCCTKITISKEERNALNMKQIHNVIHEEKWENKMLIMNWIIDLVLTTMAGIYTFCPKIILSLISIKIWFDSDA